MKDIAPILEAFDMLDIVLAVFGAVIVAMWYGRGKSVGGILSGAFVGGLVKPTVIFLMGSGLLFAAQGGIPQIKQTPEQQEKTLKFWSK